MTAFPPTAENQTPGGESPHLEYRMHLFSTGDVTVRAYLSPTLDFRGEGLRYAASFDAETPQVVDIHGNYSVPTWERWVSNNVIQTTTTHSIAEPGEHVFKFW